MRLIDTHVHMHASAFDDDRLVTLERAYAAGVRRLINVGYDIPSSVASIELARSFSGIYATAGIQPHYASATGAPQIRELRSLLQADKVVALGEIGLDYHH